MNIMQACFVSGGSSYLVSDSLYLAWDSAYYPLMMSQNIRYTKSILKSKWYINGYCKLWLTTVCSLEFRIYILDGKLILAVVVAAAIYNIGVNSHMVLWGGAYIKTPIDLIDLNQKAAFGDQKII